MFSKDIKSQVSGHKFQVPISYRLHSFFCIVLLLSVFSVVSGMNDPLNTRLESQNLKLFPSAPGAPKAPTNLKAQLFYVLGNIMEAKLTWNDNATNADGFGIERNIDTNQFLLLNTTDSGVTTYIDFGLLANHTYCYKVYSFSTTGGGNSGFTNEACITTPAEVVTIPTNLSALALSNTQIQLTWEYVSINETGFGIECSLDSGTTWSLLTTVGYGVTYFLHSGLIPGQRYCYQVYAFDNFGRTSNSNEACATTGTLPTAVQKGKWMMFP